MSSRRLRKHAITEGNTDAEPNDEKDAASQLVRGQGGWIASAFECRSFEHTMTDRQSKVSE